MYVNKFVFFLGVSVYWSHVTQFHVMHSSMHRSCRITCVVVSCFLFLYGVPYHSISSVNINSKCTQVTIVSRVVISDKYLDRYHVNSECIGIHDTPLLLTHAVTTITYCLVTCNRASDSQTKFVSLYIVSDLSTSHVSIKSHCLSYNEVSASVQCMT